MTTESLFKNSHEALTFAFNVSMQAYNRPLMNRVAAPAIGSGKWLSGLDAAGQAGIIRREVYELGRLDEAILIARHAPGSMPCPCDRPCCSGHAPNREYVDAISYLTDHIRHTALAGCSSTAILRREYVIQYFSRKEKRKSPDCLAKQHDVHRNTIDAHYGRVKRFFRGVKVGDGQTGAENQAINRIEDKLRELGIVD